MEEGELLQGRYRLEGKIGEGGFGATWAARDEVEGQRVAVKQLDMRRATDWKSIELFEREARVLRALSHPRVPRYVDSFERPELDGSQSFFLVQELAPGETLSQWVEARGWHPTREELLGLARQLLELLVYLHGLHPPVIHRDIKPQNILRQPDGEVSLVDFGSVKASLEGEGAVGGSTVVGTFGYMAPEQFRGQAAPGTDLFGVGATLVYLMTHRDPSKLPTRKLRIDTRAVLTDQDEALLAWLDRLIEPDIADRFSSASEALGALERLDAAPREPVDLGGVSDEIAAELEELDGLLEASTDPDEAREPQPRPRPGTSEYEAATEASAPSWAILWMLSMGGAAVFPLLLGSITAGWASLVWMLVAAVAAGMTLSPEESREFPRSEMVDGRGVAVAMYVASASMTWMTGWLHGLVGWSLLAILSVGVLALLLLMVVVFHSQWVLGKRKDALERALEGIGLELPALTDGLQRGPFRVDAFRRGEALRLTQLPAIMSYLPALGAPLWLIWAVSQAVGAGLPLDAALMGSGWVAGLMVAITAIALVAQRLSRDWLRVEDGQLTSRRASGGIPLSAIESWRVDTDVTDSNDCFINLSVRREGTSHDELVFRVKEMEPSAGYLHAAVLETAARAVLPHADDAGDAGEVYFSWDESFREREEPVAFAHGVGSRW